MFAVSVFAQTATSRAAIANVAGLTDGIQVYSIKQDSAATVVNYLIEIEKNQVGVREHGGPNRGPEVAAYLKSVGLNQGYAWCAAMQQWCFDAALKQAKVKRGDLARHAAVRQLFRLTKARGKLMPSSRAGSRGQLMCFQHGRTQYGHIGLVVTGTDSKGKLKAIEGNTGPDGGRDGDGVYLKVRPVRGYGKLQTEGFLEFR